jgi:hypothetical protein
VDAKACYVDHLLARYRRLPGTLGRILRDDRRTAHALYDRHIDLELVQQAFDLAIARRIFGSEQPPPIRTLRYFLPLIEEILASPPDPGYLQYLAMRLRGRDGYRSA